MTRVLQLCCYPLRRPLHGGQHRVRAIRDGLKSAGHDVHTVSVVVEGFYPGEDHDRNTVVVPRSTLEGLDVPQECYDLGLSRLVRSPGRVADEIRRCAGGSSPDVVIVEQPWLFPVAHALASGAPLIYSSQNIEFELKREILKDAGIRADALVDEVRSLEEECIRGADLVSAVSEHDVEWMAPFGPPVVLAKNGAALRVAPREVVERWRRNLAPFRSALFVASGHPPNADGFWAMLGPSLGFLPPPTQIVVVGGVCSTLLEHPRARSAPASNRGRVLLTGLQSEQSLAGLLEVADCVILPIVTGGGTNLKSAEALLSGRPVVATSKALRGFEDHADDPDVIVADEKHLFQNGVLSLLTTAVRSPTRSRHRSQSLVWPVTLKALIDAVGSLPVKRDSRS